MNQRQPVCYRLNILGPKWIHLHYPPTIRTHCQSPEGFNFARKPILAHPRESVEMSPKSLFPDMLPLKLNIVL